MWGGGGAFNSPSRAGVPNSQRPGWPSTEEGARVGNERCGRQRMGRKSPGNFLIAEAHVSTGRQAILARLALDGDSAGGRLDFDRCCPHVVAQRITVSQCGPTSMCQ